MPDQIASRSGGIETSTNVRPATVHLPDETDVPKSSDDIIALAADDDPVDLDQVAQTCEAEP